MGNPLRRGMCKECEGGQRAAPHPGPRCATHHRNRQAEVKYNAWAKRLEKVYDITAERYFDLLQSQGGMCHICQRATGKTRRLSVDHDHKTGLIRGLLCRPCNDMLGHARDDAAFFLRAAMYLNHSPAEELGIYAIHEDNR
jgi:recombination endonuclease VII